MTRTPRAVLMYTCCKWSKVRRVSSACCRSVVVTSHCNAHSDESPRGVSSQQDAAKEVEQAHLEGIDFLIANAGVGMVNHDLNTPNIELCATLLPPAGSLLPIAWFSSARRVPYHQLTPHCVPHEHASRAGTDGVRRHFADNAVAIW